MLQGECDGEVVHEDYSVAGCVRAEGEGLQEERGGEVVLGLGCVVVAQACVGDWAISGGWLMSVDEMGGVIRSEGADWGT